MLLSFALAATAFGGGSYDDLAKSLADATEKNVVIVTSKAGTVEKFSYEAGGTDILAQTIRKGAHLTMAPGGDPVFSDHEFVGTHFQLLAPALKAAPTVGAHVPEEAVKDGKLTLHTKGAPAISIEALASAKWSKPLRVDYLMRDLALSAYVTDMPEREFLSAAAKAAGGFLTSDDKGWRFMYDGEQLRARVVDTLKEEPTGPKRNELDVRREFYISVVSILPQDVLMSVFETQGATRRLNVVPNTELANVCVEYVKALLALKGEQTVDDTSGVNPTIRLRPGRARREIPSDILSRVDNRVPVHLSLSADGVIVLSVPVLENGTSRYIDM